MHRYLDIHYFIIYLYLLISTICRRVRSGRGLLAAAGALLLRQLPLGQPAAAVHRDHTGGLRRYYVDTASTKYESFTFPTSV